MKNRNEDEDLAYEEMPHLAEGDLIQAPPDDFSLGTDTFSVNTGDSDTVKPPPVAPQMATGANPAGSGPKPSAVTHPTALTTKALNKTALAGMPADVDPSELARYLEQQKNNYSKYGADVQFNAGKTMLQNRFSPGNSIANAGAGFADALMQGVARAGEGHFQKDLQDRENQATSDALGTLKGSHDTALADVKANLEMDSKDPKSPLSQSSQKSYASTLIAAGIPADQVKNMSADLISDVAGKRITLADALARLQLESTYKMGELGIQGATLNATINNQQSQRRSEAAKALEGRGVWRRTTDALTGNPATKALEEELKPGATNFEPDVLNYARQHSISPEQAAAIKKSRSGGQ